MIIYKQNIHLDKNMYCCVLTNDLTGFIILEKSKELICPKLDEDVRKIIFDTV